MVRLKKNNLIDFQIPMICGHEDTAICVNLFTICAYLTHTDHMLVVFSHMETAKTVS